MRFENGEAILTNGEWETIHAATEILLEIVLARLNAPHDKIGGGSNPVGEITYAAASKAFDQLNSFAVGTDRQWSRAERMRLLREVAGISDIATRRERRRS